jgi:hypothetical protein
MSHILHLRHIGYIKGQSMSSIILCPTNNTQSSALYKLTGKLAGWLAKKCNSIVLFPANNTCSSAIYELTDEIYNQEPSKLMDRIPSHCFLCPPPSHFFPSIYLARKWDIYYRCEYIILVFGLLCLAKYSFLFSLNFIFLVTYSFFKNVWLRR